MLKQWFEYARRERERGVYDFTQIVHGFYRKLSLEYDDSTRNTLTRRLIRMMKEYIETDPRYQSRMDEFA